MKSLDHGEMKTMRKRNFRFHLSRAAVRDKLNNNEAREVTIESDDKEVLDNTTMDESETMSLTLLTQDFKVGKPPKLIVFGHNRLLYNNRTLLYSADINGD